MQARSGGDGVDVAFDVAGDPEAIAQAFEVVRPGGTLVLVGYWKVDQVSIPGIKAMRKGLTVRFVRRMKHTFPRAIELTQRGLVDVRALISHEFPLDRIEEAFARAERRIPDVLKTVVTL
jgi:L-iditol 2-dehydrogenase